MHCRKEFELQSLRLDKKRLECVLLHGCAVVTAASANAFGAPEHLMCVCVCRRELDVAKQRISELESSNADMYEYAETTQKRQSMPYRGTDKLAAPVMDGKRPVERDDMADSSPTLAPRQSVALQNLDDLPDEPLQARVVLSQRQGGDGDLETAALDTTAAE